MTDQLFWLPRPDSFKPCLQALAGILDPVQRLQELRRLAGHDLDFLQTQQLDKRLSGFAPRDIEGAGLRQLKLAVLASSTVDHLMPAIRIAALRRGVWVECYVSAYNQYRQEVLNPESSLYAFKPEVILFTIDPREAGFHASSTASSDERERQLADLKAEWTRLWDEVRARTGATIIQSTIVVPPFPLFGHLDSIMPASPAAALHAINAWFGRQALERGLILFDQDALASWVGKRQWCSQQLWLHAKQAVPLLYAPLFGDSVAALLASLRGLSYKVLAVDLDNTLWGGVIGDDGLEGIVIGQGTGLGEAYAAFQSYLKGLRNRGVILAVCSKNEESTVLCAFDQHPDMLLRREDFAVIAANWDDKAANVQRIAQQLNVGVDAVVFFDDNPLERALVRQRLPSVAVPEVPVDPAEFVACLSRAGYFEAHSFTAEDQNRSEQYRANVLRANLQKDSRDLTDFLRHLDMQMTIAPFDSIGAARIAQLINKSNQFNLTTRRYLLDQVLDMQLDPNLVTFQVQLKDRFGDNGMISVLIARPQHGAPEKTLRIDTWLMSCRVIGRQIEDEVLNQLVEQAKGRGYLCLRGEYIPTNKNQMVRDHYLKLGFTRLGPPEDGHTDSQTWELALKLFAPRATQIAVTLDERLNSCTPRP